MSIERHEATFTSFKLNCHICEQEFGVLGFAAVDEDANTRRQKLADVGRTLKHFKMISMCDNCAQAYRDTPNIFTQTGNLKEEGFI